MILIQHSNPVVQLLWRISGGDSLHGLNFLWHQSMSIFLLDPMTKLWSTNPPHLPWRVPKIYNHFPNDLSQSAPSLFESVEKPLVSEAEASNQVHYTEDHGLRTRHRPKKKFVPWLKSSLTRYHVVGNGSRIRTNSVWTKSQPPFLFSSLAAHVISKQASRSINQSVCQEKFRLGLSQDTNILHEQ